MTQQHFIHAALAQAESRRLDALRTLSQRREEHELAERAYAATVTLIACLRVQDGSGTVRTARRAALSA